jgi:hypothetical protein
VFDGYFKKKKKLLLKLLLKLLNRTEVSTTLIKTYEQM